jgi:Flp pilus assembly protein TadG
MLQAIRATLAVQTSPLSRTKILCLTTVRRFARRNDGAAAVEFGMVAAPFLALMFAIMETALVFFASQTLETAVADSARLIMTGQAQAASFGGADKFKEAVCAKIGGLFNCQAGLYVDVKTYPKFADVNNSPPTIKPDGSIDTSYNTGGPGDIVVVRLMYQWPVYASLLGLNLSNIGSNKRLLMATAAFRNEPYGP